MACSNCNSTNPCGCTSGSYTVVPPCPPACSEVFNASCIVYTGADITCGANTVISRNDYLDSVVTKLVDYICTSVVGRDDQSVTLLNVAATGVDYALTHTLAKQYVQVLIVDVATNQDITSDFTITFVSDGNYTINSIPASAFTGDVRIVVLG